jgi:error-prone DNA polymerase
LEAHLTELRRDIFTKAGATPINEQSRLKHGQRVKIGGLSVARQHPPTANGFAFLAVEDPGGMVNVVIAPDVYARDRVAFQGAFVLIQGILQKKHKTITRVRIIQLTSNAKTAVFLSHFLGQSVKQLI